jgi:hypothetical protein
MRMKCILFDEEWMDSIPDIGIGMNFIPVIQTKFGLF